MIGNKTRDLASGLSRERNADGGWGYYPGKASRIEPTCWAALSLSRAKESTPILADGAARWLASRQRMDGFLDGATGASPNVAFNGLAALSMLGAGPWGRPRQLGMLAMGTDLVAVDATCARVIGLNPSKIPYLRTASAFLGNVDSGRILSVGESLSRYATQFDIVEHLRKMRLVQRL